jgi:hypothetical protein
MKKNKLEMSIEDIKDWETMRKFLRNKFPNKVDEKYTLVVDWYQERAGDALDMGMSPLEAYNYAFTKTKQYVNRLK